ncbi:hypothetical protein [Paenibacillus sp. GP183]|jgi:hypothetical protein|uniref:hypothetical protein n=1 Tax=Paenibacillus sp. GP183 TaxID=1882751 RepID=UPI00089A60FC|nr:hypothetical protein [Paenibacillus sp. GP183]SEC62731.1 hypothetical protein SAMN05443246_4754 [Paenibacillus sp. GP183]
MVEPQAVSSFVLRFSPIEAAETESQWRIRVTHVQGEDEIIVHSLPAAMNFIEEILKRG